MHAHTVNHRWALVVLVMAVLLAGVAVSDAGADAVVDEGPFVIAGTPHGPIRVSVAHNPQRDEHLVVWHWTFEKQKHALRVDSAGAALGSPVLLNPGLEHGGHSAHAVTVAHNPTNGEYLTVWTEQDGANRPPGHEEEGRIGFLYAQRMSATGEPVGDVMRLTGLVGDSYFCGYRSSDVRFNPATGGYLVTSSLVYGSTTEGAECGGLDPATSRVEVRSLSAAGAVTATHAVPDSNIGIPANHRHRANLGHNPSTGEFLVTWPLANPTPGEADNSATMAQRLASSGEPIGASFVVGHPTGYQAGAPGYAAGDPVTGDWMVASTVEARHVATRLSPTGEVIGVSGPFGSGTYVRDLVATGEGRWIATDENGGVTELGADGQVVGATARPDNHATALSVLPGAEPVTALALWGVSPGERSVSGALIQLLEPRPPVEPGVRRMAGGGRIETAVAISAATFQPDVAVAYVATAFGFPDALAAGPLAGTEKGPILLTTPDALAPATRSELQRLRPGRIVVLGGERVVSAAVFGELQGLTSGDVTRLSGPDRFATAAQIAGEFPPNVDVVFVATGLAFPDALAGGAVAGHVGAPIVLVLRDTVPNPSRAALERLAPRRILVLGGTGAVSDQVFAELNALASDGARRLAGRDRFATAAEISGLFDAPVDSVLVATGANFPDALAGTPAAVLRSGPILLVTATAIPDPIAAELTRLNPREIIILGGPGAVSDQVRDQFGSYLRD